MSLLNLLEEFVMFEKIRKMKNKKGFTLVELIVVLVILAILAALLVPALTGYIDKANKEKVISETRSVVMAAQTEVSEAYAKNALKASVTATVSKGKATGTTIADSIYTLAECKDGWTFDITVADGVVTQVKFSDGQKSCTYTSASSNYAVDADGSYQGTLTNVVAASGKGLAK